MLNIPVHFVPVVLGFATEYDPMVEYGSRWGCSLKIYG
jgi:hypothetical protein